MAKLPAMPWYPGDWKKDPAVRTLNYEQRGIWREMIDDMWESEPRGCLMLNGKACTDEMIANSLGLDNQKFSEVLTILLARGVARRCEKTGAIYSKRMVKDEQLRKMRQEIGKKGGNPNLVNQNSTKMNLNVNIGDNQIIENENEYENEYENEKKFKSLDFETYEKNDNEILILECWNAQNIIKHDSLDSVKGLKTEIKAALRRYKHDTGIITAGIANYAAVLKSNVHYFKNKWNLKDFLGRGLDRFIDAMEPMKNFLRDKPKNQGGDHGKSSGMYTGFDKKDYHEGTW